MRDPRKDPRAGDVLEFNGRDLLVRYSGIHGRVGYKVGEYPGAAMTVRLWVSVMDKAEVLHVAE